MKIKHRPDKPPLHPLIQMQNHCALCERELEIRTHDLHRGRVLEIAYCRSCAIKTRESEHTLH